MKKLISVAALSAALFAGAPAHAAFLDFDSPDYTEGGTEDMTQFGAFILDESISGVSLVGGNQLVLDSQGDYAEAVAASLYGTYSLLPASFISGYRLNFTAVAGRQYSFYYNVLTNQFGREADNDWFLAGLVWRADGSTSVLAQESVASSTWIAGPAGNLGYQTGRKGVNFSVGSTGLYSLEILLGTPQQSCDGGEGVCIPTFAVVDAPEPATLGLLGLGLGGLAFARRRRRPA